MVIHQRLLTRHSRDCLKTILTCESHIKWLSLLKQYVYERILDTNHPVLFNNVYCRVFNCKIFIIKTKEPWNSSPNSKPIKPITTKHFLIPYSTIHRHFHNERYCHSKKQSWRGNYERSGSNQRLFKAIYAHYLFIGDIYTILYGIKRCNGLCVHYKRSVGSKTKGIDGLPAA